MVVYFDDVHTKYTPYSPEHDRWMNSCITDDNTQLLPAAIVSFEGSTLIAATTFYAKFLNAGTTQEEL